MPRKAKFDELKPITLQKEIFRPPDWVQDCPVLQKTQLHFLESVCVCVWACVRVCSSRNGAQPDSTETVTDTLVNYQAYSLREAVLCQVFRSPYLLVKTGTNFLIRITVVISLNEELFGIGEETISSFRMHVHIILRSTACCLLLSRIEN